MPLLTKSVAARRPCQRGFTLVEAVISAGLVGFLAVTATFFWVSNFTLVQTVNNDSSAIADGRAVMERLAREIREVKIGGGAYCISTMTASQLVFNRTVGALLPTCGGAAPTATTNDYAVNVQYTGGNTVNLSYAGSLAAPTGTFPLTQQASAFTITYRDANYATAGVTTTTVRFVELNLTTKPTGGQPTQTRTVVALRNE